MCIYCIENDISPDEMLKVFKRTTIQKAISGRFEEYVYVYILSPKENYWIKTNFLNFVFFVFWRTFLFKLEHVYNINDSQTTDEWAFFLILWLLSIFICIKFFKKKKKIIPCKRVNTISNLKVFKFWKISICCSEIFFSLLWFPLSTDSNI